MPAKRPYDSAVGARIVARIAAGELLRELWRDPSLPGRYTLKRWRHEVPAFSRAVREAVNKARSRLRLAQSRHGPAARRLVLDAVAAGLTWREITALPGAPTNDTIRNWLKRDPDFRWDWAVAREMAMDGQAADADALRAEVHDEAAARRMIPRLTQALDQRRLPRKHSLYQLCLERETARTGQCPCRDCRTERAWATMRQAGT